MAFVECVCAWCEFGVVLSGVFEVCVSSAIAPPIIPLLVDWLQVPVTAGGPFVGDCPLAEFYTNTNTNTSGDTQPNLRLIRDVQNCRKLHYHNTV